MSWMNISHLCPICKQDTECTKLYLNLADNEKDKLCQQIDSLNHKLAEYKRLAIAQSKSIADKSYKIWESEMKTKEMIQTNMKLENTIKQLKIEKKLQTLKVNTIKPNLCLYPIFPCICDEVQMSKIEENVDHKSPVNKVHFL